MKEEIPHEILEQIIVNKQEGKILFLNINSKKELNFWIEGVKLFSRNSLDWFRKAQEKISLEGVNNREIFLYFENFNPPVITDNKIIGEMRKITGKIISTGSEIYRFNESIYKCSCQKSQILTPLNIFTEQKFGTKRNICPHCKGTLYLYREIMSRIKVREYILETRKNELEKILLYGEQPELEYGQEYSFNGFYHPTKEVVDDISSREFRISLSYIALEYNEETIKNLKPQTDFRPNNINELLDGFLPEIIGMERQKMALMMGYIGGKIKGLGIRPQIHILFTGYVGTGKTTLLESFAKFLGGEQILNTHSISQAGLTATIKKGGGIVPGVLMRKNESQILIDDLHLANKQILNSFYTPLESQKLIVSKAGFNLSVSSKISLVATSAIRIKTRKNLTPREKSPLPKPLLSRFDIIMDTNPDINKKKLSSEIINRLLGKESDLLRNKQKRLFNFLKEIKEREIKFTPELCRNFLEEISVRIGVVGDNRLNQRFYRMYCSYLKLLNIKPGKETIDGFFKIMEWMMPEEFYKTNFEEERDTVKKSFDVDKSKEYFDQYMTFRIIKDELLLMQEANQFTISEKEFLLMNPGISKTFFRKVMKIFEKEKRVVKGEKDLWEII